MGDLFDSMILIERRRQGLNRSVPVYSGTMKAHPKTLIVIGLLRSGIDPDELTRQGELF